MEILIGILIGIYVTIAVAWAFIATCMHGLAGQPQGIGYSLFNAIIWPITLIIYLIQKKCHARRNY